MADPQIMAFLGKAKDAWEDDISPEQKVLRDAYSSDDAKKAERQTRIGGMWMAAGGGADGLSCDQFKVFANNHFDHEDNECGGKHRLPAATLDEAYAVAVATSGVAGEPLKIA